MAGIRRIRINFWRLICNRDKIKRMFLDILTLMDVINNKVIGQNEARVQYMVKNILADLRDLKDTKVLVIEKEE